MGFYFYSFIIIVIAVIIISPGFSFPPSKSVYYLHNNKLNYRRETKERRSDFLKGLPKQ